MSALETEGVRSHCITRRMAYRDRAPGILKHRPETIELLISAGADPNTLDKSGVAPLHRAVRQRCLGAVDSLLRNGASIQLKNRSGSSALHLAVQNTGRGGSGSPDAKGLQGEIISLLLKAGADPQDRDGRGKTAVECAQSGWVRTLVL
jgi:Ankyrin repeats (many copies)